MTLPPDRGRPAATLADGDVVQQSCWRCLSAQRSVSGSIS